MGGVGLARLPKNPHITLSLTFTVKADSLNSPFFPLNKSSLFKWFPSLNFISSPPNSFPFNSSFASLKTKFNP